MKYPPGHVEQTFKAFWAAYPSNRHKARTQVWNLWVNKDLTAHAPRIMAALDKAKRSKEWKDENGKFVTNMLDWVDKDWEVEATAPATPNRHANASAVRAWWESLPPDRQHEEATKAKLTPLGVKSLLNSLVVPEAVGQAWEAAHVA